MSTTVSDCHSICNSPVNFSKSKMLFSFPKDERFRSLRINSFFNLVVINFIISLFHYLKDIQLLELGLEHF